MMRMVGRGEGLKRSRATQGGFGEFGVRGSGGIRKGWHDERNSAVR